MDRAQHIVGSAALVLGSILISALVRFVSVASNRFGSIRIRVTWVNNRVHEDSRIE